MAARTSLPRDPLSWELEGYGRHSCFCDTKIYSKNTEEALSNIVDFVGRKTKGFTERYSEYSCFELGGEDEKTGTDAERSLEYHKRGAHGHQFCWPSKMGTVETDSFTRY